jgi:hypothetical protein
LDIDFQQTDSRLITFEDCVEVPDLAFGFLADFPLQIPLRPLDTALHVCDLGSNLAYVLTKKLAPNLV